jgi:malonate transporter MadL subunit
LVIYGVALLSFCMLVGVFVGDLLGVWLGAQENIGGVGIAMLLLLILSNLTKKEFQLSSPTESGINFWSAMYIPIVVAMAAKQDVVAALSGGWMAIIAGVAAVAVSFAVIPLLDRVRIGEGADDDA